MKANAEGGGAQRRGILGKSRGLESWAMVTHGSVVHRDCLMGEEDLPYQFLSSTCPTNLPPNHPPTQPATQPPHHPARHLAIDQPSQVRATGRGHRSQPQIPSNLRNHFGSSVRQGCLGPPVSCKNSSSDALLGMRRCWGRRSRILHSRATDASRQSRRRC